MDLDAFLQTLSPDKTPAPIVDGHGVAIPPYSIIRQTVVEPLKALVAAVANDSDLTNLLNSSLAIAVDASGAVMPDSTIVNAIQALWIDWRVSLQAPAEAAVKGMVVLAGSIEALSKASEDPDDALVKKCKGQAVTLKVRFEALYNTASGVLTAATNDSLELTQCITTMQTLQQDRSHQSALAKSIAKGQSDQLKTLDQALSTARQAVEAAQKTYDDALAKNRDAVDLNNSFLGGLESIFVNDPAGVEGTIQAIKAAESTLASSQTSLNDAQNAVLAMQAKVDALRDIQQLLDTLSHAMKSRFAEMGPLTSPILHVENMALDVGTALSILVGEAVGVLQFESTARGLAKSVMEIQNVMQTNSTLTGVFVGDPESMDATLKKIAESPAPPDPYDDLNLT
ncbi:hypothetical protein K438DRAFT_1872435 [Mycena galopus ATCC 62051]|nr:hypothetical protein K438DRAFT_1872435 [Mycena galopus ATCC 62051]